MLAYLGRWLIAIGIVLAVCALQTALDRASTAPAHFVPQHIRSV
jgi:hypothetical protein